MILPNVVTKTGSYPVLLFTGTINVMSKVKSTKAPTVRRRTAIIGRIIMVLAVVILLATFWAWWHYIRNNPKNTFEAMLTNNFRTGSVTRVVDQQGSGQTMVQALRAQNQGMHVTHGTTRIQQGNSAPTIVVTESIGTPTADYTRYQSIVTSQKGSNGQDLNFDNVVNVWAKADVPSNDQVGIVYQDTSLSSLFMFADFNADEREQLLDLIREQNIYEVDYDNVEKKKVDGRPKYVYKVQIQPSKYILLMKRFATQIGLTQLEELDPTSYEKIPPLSFVVTVDVINQRLSIVESPNGSIQTFTNYGVVDNVTLPEKTIPADELQKLLTESASV